jgi:hypothetical protein
MKTRTFAEVLSKQTLLWEEHSKLTNELGVGGTTHSFMHYPWNAATAPTVILDADQANTKHKEAVSRVIDAYGLACREQIDAAPSMWTDLEASNGEFVNALKKGDFEQLSQTFSRLFQSKAIVGLGKFDETLVNDVRMNNEKSHLQLRITDALVSLGQAIGVLQVTSVEQQGVEPQLKILEVDLTKLLHEIESRIGFKLDSPKIGSTYGCMVEDRFITLDGIINAYVAHRLIQLGLSKSSSLVEIGGGFGSLAEIIYRALGCPYFLYDLPWVAAIQGYFLIMALPAGTVRLLGETNGTVQVLPFWRFADWPERSIDYLVNSDSLPEMGFDTASDYIHKISNKLRGLFLSINQEAMAKNSNVGQQNCVNAMIRSTTNLRLVSRSIYWMRQGYVEEVFSGTNATKEQNAS